MEVEISKWLSLRDVYNRLEEIHVDGDPLEHLVATVDFEQFRLILK